MEKKDLGATVRNILLGLAFVAITTDVVIEKTTHNLPQTMEQQNYIHNRESYASAFGMGAVVSGVLAIGVHYLSKSRG